MKFANHLLRSLLLSALGTSVFATDQSILQIAVNDETFSTLVSAVQKAGLEHIFEAQWYCKYHFFSSWFCPEITLFAPTNEAFSSLPEGTVERLLTDDFAPHPEDLLLYHTALGETLSTDIVNGGEITMLNKEKVETTFDGSSVEINDASVVTADVQASNGVVHAINGVLLPTSATKNIADIADDAGTFTTLLNFLQTSGLDQELTDPDKVYTVFAPTDKAFANLPDGTLDNIDITDVLLYHVLPGVVTKKELNHVTVVETAQGSNIKVGLEGGYGPLKLNGDVSFVVNDILASNGIIHVIDTVLSTPPNIVELAVATDEFSTLAGAVVAAGLADTLSGDNKLTVFAPTNAAFDKLPQQDLDDLLNDTEQLKRILLYHVVPGNAPSSTLTEGDVETALEDQSFEISFRFRWFWHWIAEVIINGNSKVVNVDNVASNGVVHTIDTVLIPSEE